jgi:hypothetical protein
LPRSGDGSGERFPIQDRAMTSIGNAVSNHARVVSRSSMVRTPNYYPLHKLQRTVQVFDSRNFDRRSKIMNKISVSNVVSSDEEYEHSATNFSGQKPLQLNEILTSESTGEQEIWA